MKMGKAKTSENVNKENRKRRIIRGTTKENSKSKRNKRNKELRGDKEGHQYSITSIAITKAKRCSVANARHNPKLVDRPIDR